MYTSVHGLGVFTQRAHYLSEKQAKFEGIFFPLYFRDNIPLGMFWSLKHGDAFGPGWIFRKRATARNRIALYGVIRVKSHRKLREFSKFGPKFEHAERNFQISRRPQGFLRTAHCTLSHSLVVAIPFFYVKNSRKLC